MKKTFLTLIGFLCAMALFAQKEMPEIAKNANKDLSAAQKATIEWVKLYDLSSDQALEALSIQKAKFQNLADIESLKTQNPELYVQKRLSSFEIANTEFKNLLDERQLTIFKQKEIERQSKYETIVSAMKKTGYSEEAIRQKLMETEF
ncbi:MAG: hypothetical protein JNL70_20330 [Saprospiraceae bacterium]|nr:hypothetical protein [Saprospiraceae bacterium]